MDLENITTYIPFVIGYAVLYLMQHNIFVKPVELGQLHLQILEEVEQKYATKENSEHLKESLSDMQDKIDKIYDKLIGGADDQH